MTTSLKPFPAGDVLITGASGQVGGELVTRLSGHPGTVHAPGRSELNLADADSIRRVVRRLRPRWIVNAGAYTAVDQAESEPELAFAVNAAAPQVLGEEARACGAAVVHFSTDYVFAGEGTRAYTEADATAPLGVYGASKLAGEQALAASGAEHLIFRTSWVFGSTGKNFLLTVLRVARGRAQMRIVADQVGAPTWSRDLAVLVEQVISACTVEGLGERAGVYHACSAGETTWHGFAEEALRLRRQMEPGVPFAELVPISTAEYPTAAKRPANSRLDCSKLERAFGLSMLDWRESTAAVVAEIPVS